MLAGFFRLFLFGRKVAVVGWSVLNFVSIGSRPIHSIFNSIVTHFHCIVSICIKVFRLMNEHHSGGNIDTFSPGLLREMCSVMFVFFNWFFSHTAHANAHGMCVCCVVIEVTSCNDWNSLLKIVLQDATPRCYQSNWKHCSLMHIIAPIECGHMEMQVSGSDPGPHVSYCICWITGWQFNISSVVNLIMLDRAWQNNYTNRIVVR